MNTRRLIAALLFALVSSGLLTWQLSSHLRLNVPAPRPLPVRQLVVAAQDLKAGDSLNASLLHIVNWPASQPIIGSFTVPQELAGRVLLISVPSGEPILSHDLVSPSASTGIASVIPNGMRAVSVRAPEEQGAVTGLVTPGSRVDVYVTYNANEDGGFVSSLVLQDIGVLASGEKPTGTEMRLRSDNVMTLLVTPEEAAQLTVASSFGKVTFALRNGTDKALISGLTHVGLPSTTRKSREVETFSSTSQKDSRSGGKPQSHFTVETLSGGKSTTQSFQGDQR